MAYGWGNVGGMLANSLRQWGSQNAPQGSGSGGPGAEARTALAGDPHTTAGKLNSDNRDAYIQYVEDTMTKGQQPLTYAAWCELQGMGPREQGVDNPQAASPGAQ